MMESEREGVWKGERRKSEVSWRMGQAREREAAQLGGEGHGRRHDSNERRSTEEDRQVSAVATGPPCAANASNR